MEEVGAMLWEMCQTLFGSLHDLPSPWLSAQCPVSIHLSAGEAGKKVFSFQGILEPKWTLAEERHLLDGTHLLQVFDTRGNLNDYNESLTAIGRQQCSLPWGRWIRGCCVGTSSPGEVKESVCGPMKGKTCYLWLWGRGRSIARSITQKWQIIYLDRQWPSPF